MRRQYYANIRPSRKRREGRNKKKNKKFHLCDGSLVLAGNMTELVVAVEEVEEL